MSFIDFGDICSLIARLAYIRLLLFVCFFIFGV